MSSRKQLVVKLSGISMAGNLAVQSDNLNAPSEKVNHMMSNTRGKGKLNRNSTPMAFLTRLFGMKATPPALPLMDCS